MGQDAAVLSKNELDLLQTALKATSDYVQGELGEEVIRLGTHFAANSPELPQIVQAIQEISSRSPKAAATAGRRSVSVNTTGTMVLPTAPPGTAPSAPGRDDDFRAELERLRAQLEAELRAAREEAERQKRRAEQALEKLEEEARRADGLMAEMRKKLKTMQSVLQKTGLQKEAEEALDASGLTGFVKGRDVFERLYQDALRRMRVQAENQMRLLGVWDSLGNKQFLIYFDSGCFGTLSFSWCQHVRMRARIQPFFGSMICTQQRWFLSCFSTHSSVLGHASDGSSQCRVGASWCCGPSVISFAGAGLLAEGPGKRGRWRRCWRRRCRGSRASKTEKRKD